jgi:hypothetical protein
MICETWWTEASVTNIKGYSIFRKDRTGKRGGGVCIFVEDSIKSYSLSNADFSNDKVEQIWCSIEIGDEKLLCGCFYRTGDSDIKYCKEVINSVNTARKLIDGKKYTGILIGGDFNFSTIKWNNENMGFNTIESYEPANLFLECLHENFLTQNVYENSFQNNINETTNVLDYIITDTSNRIFSLDHQPPLGNIDHGHHIILFEYVYQKSSNKTKVLNKRILYNNGNYIGFNAYLKNINWDKELSELKIDECYTKFLSIYEEGCKKFIPTKEYIKQNTATPPWLTKELKHLIKEKKTAWFKYRNSNSKNIELLENYKFLNSIVKKRVKKAVMAFERQLALEA